MLVRGSDQCLLCILVLASGAQQSSPAARNAGPVAASNAQATGALEEEEFLQAELALARPGGFYLVVDPLEGKLRLKLAGVELASYAILAAEVGQPHVAFVSRARLPLERPHVFVAGRLFPERQRERREVVIAEAQGEGANRAEEIPPLPEDEPAPTRFLVLFEELELEIVSTGEARGGMAGLERRLVAAARDRLALLGGSTRPRLRLVLPPADAATCYRSLPPSTSLLTPALGGPWSVRR